MSGAILGVDLSSHNGVPDMSDWPARGIVFVVIKITGGVTYVNPDAPAQIAAALAQRLLVLYYHYDWEPTAGGGPPLAEAAHCLANLPAGGHVIALDAEETATRDPVRYRAFADAVQAATLRACVFYTYRNFITEAPALDWSLLAGLPLWLAWYPADPATALTSAPPVPPAPWTQVTIWQYSGGAPMPGTSAPVDLDLFYGDASALAALGLPTGGPMQSDERAQLLADADAVPLFARGDLIREGVADLTAWGGGPVERIALYAKQYFPRIAGTTQTFFRDPGNAASYSALHAAGKITLYGDGPEIVQ